MDRASAFEADGRGFESLQARQSTKMYAKGDNRIWGQAGSPLTSLPRYPQSMNTTGNTLDDFPAEAFTILVFCDVCDRSVPLDRTKVPDGLTVQELVKKLRCSSCGSRKASIRIVYTGAGGFRYSG